ncbi:hypothetical protein VST7929_00268 [Vibrio stylophorae]|uniref:RCK C-terminal domain-containing protein n=1 Tax=Vibrio stylophorae TaxID=659351 RepID=A0ABN8DUG9_9VIBR|nr:SLC13 family permease [Vibrio stylophorae]CAH0532439.1 hypothetical protein VST7929_00268 [Vibrio stylophorae]
MSWEQGLVLAMLLTIISCLALTKLKPAWVFAASSFAAFQLGLVELPQLANNFTNDSLVTLVLLILSSVAVEKTRLIGWVGNQLSSGSLSTVLAKLGLSTAFLSSFTNNTAVVASLIGAIKRNQRHAPSKLLLPLSYAAILGGTLTLIGTSTNLIINSFVVDAGLPSLGFFAPTLVGLALLLCGLPVLVLFGRFSPEHDAEHDEGLPYFLEATVNADSPLVGRSVADNGLRALRKLFLAEVVREGKAIAPVRPSTLLQAGDKLLFCGDVESVATLQEIDGLSLFGQHHLNGQSLQELVVSHSASLRGQTLKSSRFRERYDAVVVAIRRGHERLAGGLGNVVLLPGDTLVVVPGRQFMQELRRHPRDFVLINDLDSSARLDRQKSAWVLAGFAAVMALGIGGLLPIINGLAAYLLLLLCFRVVTLNELRRRFPIDIVVIVGCALTLAQLMMSTGLSVALSQWVMAQFHGQGVFMGFVAVYLLTLLLTEVITNNAAAALAFPIGYSLALGYDANVMPFVMAVLFGASASFISPYGYQTNLLVYSVGNYRLKDYVKLGLPLSLVYSAVVILLVPKIFPF